MSIGFKCNFNQFLKAMMNKLQGEPNKNVGLYFPYAERSLHMAQSTKPGMMMMPRYLSSSELELQNRYQWSLYQAYYQNLYNPHQNMPITGSLPFRNASGPSIPRCNMYPQQLYCGNGYPYAPQAGQTQLFVPGSNFNSAPTVTVPQNLGPRPHSQEVPAPTPRIPIKLDFSKVPVAPPKPTKKERPEVIVLEDSEPEVNPQEEKKIQPQPPSTQVSHSNGKEDVLEIAEHRDVTVPVKENIVAKEPAPLPRREKQTTVPAVGKKTAGRTVVKTLVVEEGKNDTSLRIRIKKISKGPKPPQSEKPKPQERALRERRVITSEWPKLPRYSDSPGKIRSGMDHQTILPDFLLNEPSFQEQKQRKRQQLLARRTWNKTHNQPLYQKLRSKFPNVAPDRIIAFIKDKSVADIQSWISEHQDQIRRELEAEQTANKDSIVSEDSPQTRMDCQPVTIKA